jgi:hypothetical protein
LKAEEWFSNRKTKPLLQAEQEYEARFSALPDILKAYTSSIRGENSPSLHVCLQGNNYLLGLDCSGSVFINFSLFERSFPYERAVFLYDLAQCIVRISLESQSSKGMPNQSI